MELIRGLQNLRPKHQGCVATIGTFDGLHLGHQRILVDLQKKAVEHRLPSCVIIFEPQPDEFFLKKEAPARLSRLREKLIVLQQFDIDRVLCLQFTQAFSQLSADEFINQILVDGLGVKHLVVGDDFRFGHKRAGDFALLQQAGNDFGFKVEHKSTLEIDNERISSTRVRKALEHGELTKAEQLLGRPYGMCGRVAHGDKRGRIIGFPTANIYLHRNVTPILGVYVVKVYGLPGGPVQGVANVGNRPTFDGTRTLLEIHLFDFDQDIYGHYVRVDFMHKLRDEKRFDSFELLKEQIFKDAENAKLYFHNYRDTKK